eukprot:gene4668-9009_t
MANVVLWATLKSYDVVWDTVVDMLNPPKENPAVTETSVDRLHCLDTVVSYAWLT